MIAGALEFTLGMQANQFIGNLGLAGNKLLGFVGIASSIQSAFHKMWEAIERGGALKDLAVRANTSVGALYQIQKGFEQIGVSADSATPLILKLQRQLASNEGASVLKSLGLDPGQLQGQDTVGQINAIVAAMSGLNTSAQSQVAFKLFGREGATSILQIARSGKEFQEAMAAASDDAKIWQSLAGRFDAISDKVVEIRGHIQSAIALFTGALIAAFEGGTLGALLTDTMSTAFQVSFEVLLGAIPLLGAALIKAFETPLTYIQAGMEYAIQEALNNPKLNTLLKATPTGSAILAGLDAVGIGPSGRQSFESIFKERQAEGVKFDVGTGEFGVGDIQGAASANFNERMKAAGDTMAAFRDKLFKLVDSPSALVPDTDPSAEGGRNRKLGAAETNVTSIEKMGFVFAGGGGRQDYARATADNTRRSADLLKGIHDKISGGTETDYSNLE